ncbi:hypothetical protein Kisp02_15600 [Kineosporia sp. NBRC 101731]|nr:hypothetical protein Kisp02_15600 [Kineosporia sp. NBRC 101731]
MGDEDHSDSDPGNEHDQIAQQGVVHDSPFPWVMAATADEGRPVASLAADRRGPSTTLTHQET